jgi:flagellar protein FlaF
LDSGIPALVIGAIILVAASFLARSSLSTYDAVGQRLKEVQARTGEQARTRLSVTSTSLDPTRSQLTLQVRNDGQVPLATWASVDLIVTYTAASTQHRTWCGFDATGTAPNSWRIASIAPDVLDPGLLDPGETATITVTLGTPVDAGASNVVIFGAENGVTVSAIFTS